MSSRTHVAPCSCELHVRIRELEAELARRREEYFVVVRERQDMKARAEKAEARVAELENEYDAWERHRETVDGW